MRWFNIRLFPARFFNANQQENGESKSSPTSDKPDKSDPGFLEKIAAASWVLPELQPEPGKDNTNGATGQSTGVPGSVLYKRKGFSIAMANGASAANELEQAIAVLKDQEINDHGYIQTTIEEYNQPFITRRDFQHTIIAQLTDQLGTYHSSYPELLAEKKRLTALRDQELAAKKRIELEVAGAKKDLLTNWLQEVEKQAQQIQATNARLLKQKQAVAEEMYQHNKVQNDHLVEKLRTTRNQLQDEYNRLKEVAAIIGDKHSGNRGIKFLLNNAYIGSIAAGLFFSIFTMHSAFSSEDIVFFLFNGLKGAASNMEGIYYSRIFQLLGVLAIIGLAALLSRSVVVHIKRRQQTDKEEEQDEQYLYLKIKNDTVRYSSKFKSNSWPVFWFKILPFLLVAGTLIIFIARADTQKLDTSMAGVLMGVSVAVAVAAFINIYIVKIIEPRLIRLHHSGQKTWKSHFAHAELIITLLFFIAATLFAAVHTVSLPALTATSPDLKNVSDYRMIALLWFLSVALLCGFVMGYGIRYQSLRDLQEELDNKVLGYDSLIDQYSGVVRSNVSYYLHARTDMLMRKLMDQLVRRNDLIHNDRIIRNVEIHPPDDEQATGNADKDKRKRRRNWHLLWHLLREVLFPSEHIRPENSPASSSYSIYDTVVKWEKEFFADQYHAIDVHRKAAEQYEKELQLINNTILKFNDIEQEPVVHLLKSLKKATDEQEACNQQILKANLARAAGINTMRWRYRQAIDLILSGYETATWYKSEGSFSITQMTNHG